MDTFLCLSLLPIFMHHSRQNQLLKMNQLDIRLTLLKTIILYLLTTLRTKTSYLHFNCRETKKNLETLWPSQEEKYFHCRSKSFLIYFYVKCDSDKKINKNSILMQSVNVCILPPTHSFVRVNTRFVKQTLWQRLKNKSSFWKMGVEGSIKQ